MRENFKSIVHILAKELYDLYDSFKIDAISSNHFKQSEMLEWIGNLGCSNLIECEKIGNSAEGRAIYLYSFGNGTTNILIWSQMHGDESTATMALLDIFSFFSKNHGHTVTKNIEKKLRLLIIPMLNPDGAEYFTRHNAQLIDINRDALALITPEGKILKETRERFRPAYAFNLHDQATGYTVGLTKRLTAIALAAPPFDEEKTDNITRIKAKKVANVFAQIMHQFIPDHIAKWDDTFEPRAFGDNFQKQGTSTILIESGRWQNDPNKFFIRKLNCVGILATLFAIAIGETTSSDTQFYDCLPYNKNLGYDCIIRNANLRANSRVPVVKVDVGINFERKFNKDTRVFELNAKIVEVGNLENFISVEREIDATGKSLDPQRIVIDQIFPANEIDSLFK